MSISISLLLNICVFLIIITTISFYTVDFCRTAYPIHWQISSKTAFSVFFFSLGKHGNVYLGSRDMGFVGKWSGSSFFSCY